MTVTLLRSGRKSRRRRCIFVDTILAVMIVVLAAAMLLLGNTIYSPEEVVRVFMGERIPGAHFSIISLRFPRMLAAILAGLAFGSAGAVFQTMLRNPLASPDIIGISAGSSVAAVVCIIIFRLSGMAVSVVAVAFGMAVALLIYALSRGKESAGGRLILIGIGIGAFMNAVVSYVLLKAPQYDVPAAYRWLTGSLNAMRLGDVLPLAIIVVIVLPLVLMMAHKLKAVELGDAMATALGVRVEKIRLFLVLGAVALVAFATSTTGPIAFVAFLSGPIAARLVGAGMPYILPAALLGAALVLGADLVGQFAFDTKFPVGVITGILGAPYLLFLLIRLNRSGGSL